MVVLVSEAHSDFVPLLVFLTFNNLTKKYKELLMICNSLATDLQQKT